MERIGGVRNAPRKTGHRVFKYGIGRPLSPRGAAHDENDDHEARA